MENQFLENRQNYMMENNTQHLNNATAGCENANVGGVAENVSVGGEILGAKYDEQLQHHEEHDVGDDDELKYVKEVQQSEKQQQQSLKNFGLGDEHYDSNDFAENKAARGALDFGNGGGAFVFGGNHLNQHQDHQELFNLGNGHNTNGNEIHQNENTATNEDFVIQASTGFEEKNPFDIEIGFKIEGDFSSTSNNTESVEEFVPQVDVKIESKPEQEQEHQELGDEEEPSSLATNTTNGTSSLSENIPQQATAQVPANAFDDLMATIENKENSLPLSPQRPYVLDIDQAQSLLNPDAQEFIPSFGSNPASPTSPFATGIQSSDLGEPMETQMYFGQQPSAVPRHLLGDDDFVAHSPRKGRGDNNMDSVSLPKEQAEFIEEADKRPHELEPEDVDVLQNIDGVMTPDQQVQQLPLDDIVNEKENQDPSSPHDITDFQPSSFMDHGPETCVDLDADLDVQPAAGVDLMKTSMYVTSDIADIVDILNNVQVLPTEIDSVNNSFIEESATESAAANIAIDKELLQVEEKEHVSHSPSTEEIQMNLQNTLNSSNKDIPQLPIDMDNANNMQESMYEPQEQSQETQQQEQIDTITINTPEVNEESLLADTTNPIVATADSFLNNSFEPQQEIQESFESHAAVSSTPDDLNIDFAEITQQALSDGLTLPLTTDDKHLLDETQEQQLFSMSGLEQQMNELLLSNDSHLSQAEDDANILAVTATFNSEHPIYHNVSAVDEEDQTPQQQMLIKKEYKELEQELVHERQQEPIAEPVQEFIESPMHNQQLENEMVAVEEPLCEAKATVPLFNTEETEIVNEHQQEKEAEIPPPMVPETAPAELLEQPQFPLMDNEAEFVKSLEEIKPMQEELPMEVVEEPKQEMVKTENLLAVEEVNDIAATAAMAATAAIAAVGVKVAASPSKKSEVAKKPLAKTPLTTAPTTAKPKVGGTTTAAKKPLEAAKKPIGLAAKPRAAPAKTATTSATAEKKPITKTSTTTTTTARKPLSAGTSAAPKPAAKTTTTTSTTRTTARPTTTTTRLTTATRPMTTTTTTRKPLTTTTTNGPAAKPRPATAPAKPTSLGLPATSVAAKTKVISPRATLTSQLRKTAPTTTTTTAKSPVKSTATNGVPKTATSTLASRTKTTTSTASTAHGTGTTAAKTFTARPAPKFTTSSSSTTTTTTTRRLTVGGNTAATTTTTTTTKTSGAPLRKSSPSKPLGGRTPTKSSNTSGGFKSKTPLTKKESPPEVKPAPIRKPVDKNVTNGEVAANISKELNFNADKITHHEEQQQPLNGNALLQAVQQNGDSSIPNQQSLLEQNNEQIPMDLINA